MDIDDTLRVEMRFKNNRLYRAIADDAVPSWSERTATRTIQTNSPVKGWCDLHGLNLNKVYGLLNLRSDPQKEHKICQRIAALLNREAAWLFPESLYRVVWPRAVALETSPARMVSLSALRERHLAMPATQESDYERRELVRTLMSDLKPRQRRIVERTHIDGCSLLDVSKEESLSRAGVREIQKQAIKKLRKRVKRLRLIAPWSIAQSWQPRVLARDHAASLVLVDRHPDEGCPPEWRREEQEHETWPGYAIAETLDHESKDGSFRHYNQPFVLSRYDFPYRILIERPNGESWDPPQWYYEQPHHATLPGYKTAQILILP